MDDARNLALRALHEINGVKYLYRRSVEGAISAAAHKEGITLSPELRADTYDIVVEALPNMGFRRTAQR